MKLVVPITTALALIASMPANAQQDPQRGQSAVEAQSQPSRSSVPSQAAGERRSRTPTERRTDHPSARSEQTGTDQGLTKPAEQKANRSGQAREERSNRADRDRTTGNATRANGERQTRERDRAAGGKADHQRSTADQSREERPKASSHSRDRLDRDRTDQARQRDESKRGSIALSEEQRTQASARFSERIDRMNVRPLSRSRISVSIGARVPRSIHLYAIPRDIISVYPEFRGRRFVVVDDEIVIIEPSSYEIVAVLPLTGGDHAGATTTGAAVAGPRVRLSQEQRRTIHTVVMREPACRLEQRLDFFIGIPIPRTVEVCEFPPEIVSEIPELRPYRYAVRGDEVVLIDPDDHRVVEVIE